MLFHRTAARPPLGHARELRPAGGGESGEGSRGGGEGGGVGLVQGRGIVRDRETKEQFDPDIGVNVRLTQALRDRGVWIRMPPYILPLAPPLIITADELDALCDAVDESLSEVEQQLGIRTA